MSRSFLFASTALLLALGCLSCERMPLTAPTGSSVTLTVNTTALPLNGTAGVTAIVQESSGTPPQNGTVVTFTSTLGTIEPREARTTNGLATATFTAGGTAGTARIGAVSGGAAAEAVEVIIGAGQGSNILLNVETVSNGRATIVATVLDASGNPLSGATVAFSADTGQLSPRTVTTDGNGEARTTLTTSSRTTVTARAGPVQTTIVVDATPITVTLTIGAPFEGVVAFTANATPPAGASIQSYEWSFGDGGTATTTGPSVTHEYDDPGTYIVAVRVRASNGTEGLAEAVVSIPEEP